MEEESVLPSADAVDASHQPDEAACRAEAAVEVIRLQAVVAARENRILELEASLAEREEESAGLEASRREAVASYARMAVIANPGILPELVTGETVADVDASLSRARALVERIRLELDAQSALDAVPAGAPPRLPLDVAGMSAAEKIRYAVGRSSQQ